MSNLHGDIADVIEDLEAAMKGNADGFDVCLKSSIALRRILQELPSPAPAAKDAGTDSDGSERGVGGDDDRRPGGKSNDRHL